MASPSAFRALGLCIHVTDIGFLLVLPKSGYIEADHTTNKIILNLRSPNDPR